MRTRLHPERSADAEHSHEEHEGAESSRGGTVSWIADGTDNNHKDGGSKELERKGYQRFAESEGPTI